VPSAGLALLLFAVPACGEGVGWRGDGTGRYPNADPPTQWDIDQGTNILWQIEVGPGQSSPVVMGKRIFITAARDLLLCLDLYSGKVLWKRDNGYEALPAAFDPPKKRPPAYPSCGYCTPTPVTDGNCVYASYGTGIVVCYDLDGRRRWIRYFNRRQLGGYGRTASPLLVGGKLLVSIGGLLALDPPTGKTRWETTEAKPTYGTPAAARIADVDLVVTPNGDCVRVADGRILARGLGKMQYPSPVVHEGIVYFVGEPTVAVKLEARGDEEIRPKRLWQADDMEGPFYASPLCHDALLYCVSNQGVLYALDAKTGKSEYRQQLEIPSAGGMPGMEAANIYASLTMAGRHLLLTNDIGDTLVLAPGSVYREHAHNYLDEGSGATAVADGGLLLLRGSEQLYCIGSK
jgi:outer membrane protein assembly factor BamB